MAKGEVVRVEKTKTGFRFVDVEGEAARAAKAGPARARRRQGPGGLSDLEGAVDLASREGILSQKPELSAVMENFDSDSVDPDTLMSTIDLNTRLSSAEVRAVLTIDGFGRLGIYPQGIMLARQFKRLKVSEGGRGREEKVRVVAGERERRDGGGFLSRMGGFFSPTRR